MAKVTLIGALNVDYQGFSYNKLNLGDCNVGWIHTTSGGVARNIAEVMKRLDNDVSLISVVGNDHIGEMLRKNVLDLGIDSSGIFIHEGTSSSFSAILGHDGELGLGLSDMRMIETLSVEELQKEAEKIRASDVIVLDTCVSKEIIDATFDFGVPVFLDPVGMGKVEKTKDILSKLQGIKCNALEAEALTGIEGDPLPLARKIHEMGVKEVLLSTKDGIYYVSENEEHFESSLHAEATNVSGAGDTLLGTFLSSRLRGDVLTDALQYGMIAASLSVQSLEPVSSEINWEHLRLLKKVL
ncbi:PfkB family carbohydrate kinase [Guggenheimella bovis]